MPELVLADESPTMPPLVMDTRGDDTDDTDGLDERVPKLEVTVKAYASRTSITTLSLVVQILLLLVLGCLTAEVWVSTCSDIVAEGELMEETKYKVVIRLLGKIAEVDQKK